MPGAGGGRPADRVAVEFERLSGGHLRVTSPDAPTWAMHVRPGATEMARAVRAAMDAAANEAAVEAYRGKRPRRPPTRPTGQTDANGRRVFRRSHDPMKWVILPNGNLRAPGGNEYRPQTQIAQRILAARARAEQQATPPSTGAPGEVPTRH